MAKPVILFFPFGFLSHYLRCIVLARKMKGNFDILFAANARFNRFVEKEGFGIFECLSFSENSVICQLKQFDFSWLNKAAIERIFVSQVAAINRYDPIFVIGDNSPTLKMAAEKTRICFFSVQNGYMSRYYAGKRALSHRHPAYSFLRYFPDVIIHFFTSIGEKRAFIKIHQPFKQLRKEQSLTALRNYNEELEGDLNLICDLPMLFPQRELPSGYFIIGPLIYDEPSVQNDFQSFINPEKKTIYVNTGSTGDGAALSFLNDEYFRRFNIITAGEKPPRLDHGIAIHFSFLPASAILPFADLVICHGGNGIVNQCLYYGVPMLFKTAWFEQEWNAHAIEKVGCGMCLDQVSSPLKLREIVDFWIDRKQRPVRMLDVA